MILRPIHHWLLFFLLGGAALRAAEVPPSDQGSLDSWQGIIDRKTGHWHFWEKVHLNIPGTLELWCEDLVVNQSTDAKGKRTTDRIVAQTNVVILMVSPASGDSKSIVMKPGETNRATAFQAVFDAVKGTVELTGSDATGQPQVEGPDASMRADRLIFDRARGSFSGFGNYLLIFKSGAIKDIFNSTNSPAAPARKSSAPPP